MKVKAIITGVTGMVGEGVLHECLLSPDVEQVLIITRKPSGITHPKVKEIVHKDFHDISAIEGQLTGYNACFFCLGVSSVGMKEPEYFHLTYELTVHVAKALSRLDPAMTFCYVSGSGTDSSEKGRSMWARVKGKTENKLMSLPFRKTYMFRPGYMHPTKGLKNTLKAYRYISWMYPIIKTFSPNSASTLKELGVAMINVVTKGYDKQILEVKHINAAAR
jgi:uncharacterized protein YbjT (DUF2867 family)